MNDIGQIERKTQNRLEALLRDQLGYTYAENLEALHKQANKMRMVGEAMKQSLLTGKVRLA